MTFDEFFDFKIDPLIVNAKTLFGLKKMNNFHWSFLHESRLLRAAVPNFFFFITHF